MDLGQPVRNKRKWVVYSSCINWNPSGFVNGLQNLHKPKGCLLSAVTIATPKALCHPI